jgi:hypothetical protein
MVDAPDFAASNRRGGIGPASMENLRRIKSTVFFANFLRFKTIAITRNLSMRVSKEPDCENNRNPDCEKQSQLGLEG